MKVYRGNMILYLRRFDSWGKWSKAWSFDTRNEIQKVDRERDIKG